MVSVQHLMLVSHLATKISQVELPTILAVIVNQLVIAVLNIVHLMALASLLVTKVKLLDLLIKTLAIVSNLQTVGQAHA